MEKKYLKNILNMLMISFVLVTVFNSTFAQFDYNFIKFLSNSVNRNFNLNINLENIFYILAGIFAIFIAFNRDTWLPFLGKSVFPSIFVPLKKIEGNTTITVNVKPNVKVAYWASKPSLKEDQPVKLAYDDYSNSGVVMSDNNGVAIISINKGPGYYVPSGNYIKSHVHYRELSDDYAMMGPVRTIYLQ